jgi:hypothetical protein
MKMQFFHVEDLCRFMEILLEQHPAQRIFNVGNPEAISIAEWVQLCYDAVGAELKTIRVEGHPQRSYFCFHDYDYFLDVTKQTALMPRVKPLAEGLQESYAWFRDNRDSIAPKPYIEYADTRILRLVQAKPEEAELAAKMQQEAFAELLERYQDHDTNPANEGVDRILWKIQNPGSFYYFIICGCFMMTVIVGITMKVSIDNPLLQFLGQNVMGIYAFHRLPLLLVRDSGLDTVSRVIFSMLATAVLCFVFNYTRKWIDSFILLFSGKKEDS